MAILRNEQKIGKLMISAEKLMSVFWKSHTLQYLRSTSYITKSGLIVLLMKLLSGILSVASLLLISCNQSSTINSGKPFHVNLEKDINNVSSIPLSNLGKSLEYIPLQTDSNCLIHTISALQVFDSLIFVGDYHLGLYVFDRRGKFIRKIGSQGRGPGEYNRLYDLAVDFKNHEVTILDGLKIFVYDFNGEFKRDITLGFPSHRLVLYQEKEIAILPFSYAKASDNPVYSINILDRQKKIKLKIPSTSRRINEALTIPISPLYIYQDTLHFMEFGVDTLYKYDGRNKIPHLIFNPGTLKFPADPTMSEVPGIDGKIWVSDVIESNEKIFIKMWWDLGDSISNCIFDKKTSEFSILRSNGFVNDIDGGCPFWPIDISEDTLLVGYIDAYKLILCSGIKKTEDSTKLDFVRTLTETSNPVIVVVHNNKCSIDEIE